MIDIINFSMTASASANYVLDIFFTILIKAVLPPVLVRYAIDRYFR